MATKKLRLKLPQKIIAIPNRDKFFHEKWEEGRDLLNLPHPFRALFLGPPNTGKTTMVKNILLRADPPFEEIFIIHCDPEYTQEYDDLYNYDKNGKRDDAVELLKHIPAPEEFEGTNKTLVICDDLELKEISKEQRRALDRLFGFVSTHKNISVCLCSQDPFNVPPIVRRCSNVFVLWRLVDMDSMAMTTRKTGLEAGTLKRIFNKLMTEPRDSLWIDLTDGSPAKLRKNGYEVIQRTKKKSSFA